MLIDNYSTTENQYQIPVQKSFFGADKYLADTRHKLASLYRKNPDIADSEKKVIISYWQAYEGLADVLGDKLDSFIEWFFEAQSPETITRSLRALKEDGTVSLSSEKQKQRQEKEQQWRTFWGNEKRLREDNGK